MKRSEVLCPECFKKKLLRETETKGFCDNCGTEFIFLDDRKVRYKPTK